MARQPSPGAQGGRAHQMMGDRVPQNHRFGFDQIAHVELPRAAVAGNGVDALGGRGTFLVDLLRRGRFTVEGQSVAMPGHNLTIGHGKIFVSQLSQVVRIRTGESGAEAI